MGSFLPVLLAPYSTYSGAAKSRPLSAIYGIGRPHSSNEKFFPLRAWDTGYIVDSSRLYQRHGPNGVVPES